MGQESHSSKPFNLDELKKQAESGELDFLVAYTRDGEVIDYARGYGEETVVDLRDGPSEHLATKMRFIASSSVYWYCDKNTKTWWKCRVRNGIEKCKDSEIPCEP